VTHLYLIRHAESVLARNQHIRDIMTEDALTHEGIHQAERLRDRLAATHEINADAVLASTYPRARQTADIIAPALDLSVTPDDDLQEWRPGDSGGMYWDEYTEKHGRTDPWREPFRMTNPTEEHWGHFMLRVASTLHRIAHEYEGKHVVLVCHGGIIDGSILTFMGHSTFFRPHFSTQVDNTSITHWEHFTRDGYPRWRLIKFNDALHLRYNVTKPDSQGGVTEDE
jgi:probable phosphoglycerate mutase